MANSRLVGSDSAKKQLRKSRKYDIVLKMKKLFKIVSIIIALLTLTGVLFGCSDKPKIAKTPEQEYARIKNMDGENTIFNFSTLTKLQIEQTISMSSAEILEANSNSPTKETMLFQLDRNNTSNIKSYGSSKKLSLMQLSNPSEKIKYETSEYSFNNNRENGDSTTHFPDGYNEYLSKRPGTMDVLYRTSTTLFDYEKLENISGKKSGGIYTIEAAVKIDNQREFLDWFLSFYPCLFYKYDSTYPYFDENTVSNAVLQVKSSAVSLTEVSASFKVKGKSSATEEITITSKTVFSRTGFDVKEI